MKNQEILSWHDEGPFLSNEGHQLEEPFFQDGCLQWQQLLQGGHPRGSTTPPRMDVKGAAPSSKVGDQEGAATFLQGGQPKGQHPLLHKKQLGWLNGEEKGTENLY